MGERLGTIKERTLVLERRLDAPPSRVWKALVEPDELADWLAPAEVELRVGGRIVLRFENGDHMMKGEITEVRAPEVLEYTWGGEEPNSVVRFELAPDGEGTILTLRHTLLEDGTLAGFGAGWHHHLELLAARTSDGEAEWDSERYERLKTDYEALEAKAR